ncbi:MAG: hypothetical protein AUJ92_19695 [Armatimonadetes bacterium CG2_30_59_28]|nr:methyltransferase domain-containing protein [Armatimonadota bacterium]OIO90036.1 MAG: hypothetical protein AUJ92_19695 [Armatimonadetes bacterium CG2_30_59_28]
MCADRPIPKVDRPCAVCSSRDARIIRMEEIQPVVRCLRCGYIYCNPVPSEVDLLAYYDGSYTDWDHWEQTFRHDRQYVFTEGLRRICRYQSEGKLLDVGCSLGIFLEGARAEGFECHGVEVSEPAARFAGDRLRLNVFQGTLHEARYPCEFFDVVTLWDVLEHVPDPRSILREIRRILKPRGLAVVRVPNVNFHLSRSRILSAICPQRDPGLDTLNHLNHFSAHSLLALMRRQGFERPVLLPGTPNIYGRPLIDSAKKLYNSLAQMAHSLLHLEIATIIEAYAFRRP